MSSGGGSGSDGREGGVSGMEAVVSQEKGISTHADTRVQRESFSPGGEGQVRGDQGGVHDTGPIMGPDTSLSGSVKNFRTIDYTDPETGDRKTKAVSGEYTADEIEKGYTKYGEKLSQVGAGKYMTEGQLYSSGLIEKEMVDGVQSGEDKIGRYRINENTGEFERTNLSFAEHLRNSPVKFSPLLSLLYASGKNLGEYFRNKNFKGYNEAGLIVDRGGWRGLLGGSGSGDNTNVIGEEREAMNILAPHAPYIISGIKPPPGGSPAADWYASLGKSSTSGFQFSFSDELKAAKAKQAGILGKSSAVGQLAVNQSPFYNWLKQNKLDRGIL